MLEFLTMLGTQFLTMLGLKSPADFAMCLIALVVVTVAFALPRVEVSLPLRCPRQRANPNAQNWRAYVNAITISVSIPSLRVTSDGLVLGSSSEFKLSSVLALLEQGSENLKRAYAKARHWLDGQPIHADAILTWTTHLYGRVCCQLSRVHIALRRFGHCEHQGRFVRHLGCLLSVHLRWSCLALCELKALFITVSSVRFELHIDGTFHRRHVTQIIGD